MMPAGGRSRAKFSVGDPVRIGDQPVEGHCRTPWYLRGKCGEIVEIHGAFRDPERLAYHRPGFPELVLYKVRVRQKDLWPRYQGPENDNLEVDIYEPWLSPASGSKRPPQNRGAR